mgnify:CR=1 FL=1
MRVTTIAAGLLGLALSTGCTSNAQEWDITQTGQPYQEVELSLTEGTWISVAVSPVGDTIVFDVLGDIYSMPATGGAAELVHGGPAIQHSPVFSRTQTAATPFRSRPRARLHWSIHPGVRMAEPLLRPACSIRRTGSIPLNW